MNNLNAFYTIADIAATNWYIAKTSYWGRSHSYAEAMTIRTKDPNAYTFRKPNFAHPTGYFAFLKFIADHERGVSRKELREAFNVKSVSLTCDGTLCNAGLVKLDAEYTHKFTVTPFGRAYLALAELARPALEAINAK